MKTWLFVKLLFLSLPVLAFGQNFTFESDTLHISGKPGELLILDADIKNLSQQELHIRVIRVENNLPVGWTSSLCSGALCYPPERNEYTIPDSTAGIPAIAAGETAEFHLNINTGPTRDSASVLIRVINIDDENEFAELTFTASTAAAMGITKSSALISGSFRLLPNYPDPFNPSTKIPFEIGGNQLTLVQLTVYNLLGQKVVKLLNKKLSVGYYEVDWDGRDQSGIKVPSGLYLYELRSGAFQATGKMILSK